MSLSKISLLLVFISPVLAQASPLLNCPAKLKDGRHIRVLSVASLFEGKPEELGDLMPDTDDEAVWTLLEYQESAKKYGSELYFVCRYEKTKKTVTLKVPNEAKTCSVIVSKGHTLATCE